MPEMSTPGPWGSDCFLVTASNGREVTHTGLLGRRRSSHDGQSGETEDKVNARLIAAAPDLLAACQAAIRYDAAIQQCANDPAKMSSHCTADGDSLDTLYGDWIDKSRAAIAKALGESK